MGYIDILDEEGNCTGKTDTRENVHSKGLWHKAVHIWVVNNNGDLIIQRRSPDKQTNPNMWTTSTSGHLSAGDNNINGAIRELSEEIGLIVKETQLEYLFTVKEHKTPLENYIDNEFVDVFLITMNVDITKLKVQKEEVSEVKYIPYKELKQMALNNDKSLVAHKELHAKLFEILEKRF